MKPETKQMIQNVMTYAKCDMALAKRALKATKGQHWTQAVIYAKDEIATLSVPTGNTCFDEFFKKD